MSSASSPIRFSLTPVLWLATAFAAGIGVGHTFEITLLISGVVSGWCCILAFLLRQYSAATLLVCAAFSAAGAGAHTAEKLSVRPDRIKVLYDNGTLTSGHPVEI